MSEPAALKAKASQPGPKTYPGEQYVSPKSLEEFEKMISVAHGKGWRLMTITAVDLKDKVELIYHFDTWEHMHHIRYTVDPEVPHVSLVKLYPSAFLFENEIAELMGVKVQGIEGKIFLGKDMAGMHPLKKSFKVEEFLPKESAGLGHKIREATSDERFKDAEFKKPDLKEGDVCYSDAGEESSGSSDVKVKAKDSRKGGK